MTPGTTPTHTFTLPIDTGIIAALRITYEQGGKIILQKELADCEADGYTLTVKLTQTESLLFQSNVNVRIQIKCRTIEEDVMVSDVISKPAYILLDKEVI